ncbi:unnamed protein product [Ostreobium quekettii]|uniref:Exportin-T n=1 Tax=Ostreobium quekettii TaxID=121088 RepID=A0A8S1IVF5_9CHLO|nr:unnamed protein product [Ostreobium quekettii]|eukprot:evm.model.scf_27.22 EVM.evm.TU.scf_27.22   scf_27:176380-184545(-)
MADDFEKAVLLSFDQTGAVERGLKEQAVAFCNNVKIQQGSWRLFLERFRSSGFLEVKFWCLQALQEFVDSQFGILATDDRNVIKSSIMGWVQSSDISQQPAFLRNKLSQLTAAVIRLEYPDGWPSCFSDLISAAQRGRSAVDIFCRIMLAIDSDVITLEIPRSSEGNRMSMQLKDAMRDHCIGDIAEAWYQLASTYSLEDPDTAGMVLKTVQRYIGWIDIGLVANDRFIHLLYSLLSSTNSDLQEAAVECLTEVLVKGMDPLGKLELIQKLRLVACCAQWSGGLPGAEGDELQVKSARLLAALAQEVLECWKQVKNRLVSFKAVGLNFDKELAKEAAAAVATCEGIVDELFPAVMTVLQNDDETVSMTIVPFLTAYVTKLKAEQKRSATVSDNASNHLKRTLDGMLKCASYPSDSAILEQNGGTEVEMAAIKEEQEAVEDRRRDLLTLFKNIARVMMSPTVQFVDSRLGATLCNPESTFQDVELVLTLLHELGEAASDEVAKQGCGALGPLVLKVVRSTVPHASHSLVALAVLEILVRYSRVMQQHQDVLPSAVANFIDGRGMRNSSEVSVRACYLFMRFIKALRSNLRPLTASLLTSLEPFLKHVAQTPQFDGMLVGGTRQQGAAPPSTVSTDDRMCVFEAVGLLIGPEDVPSDRQRELVVAVLEPLMRQIEGCLGVGAQQPTSVALVQQALEGISRLSKGFKQELATNHRPEIGQLFVQAFDEALLIPQTFPDSKSLRARFISFVHRMVETIGTLTLPYLPMTLQVLMHQNSDTRDTCDVLALVNQLINRFRGSLSELLLKALPAIQAEVHGKLTPEWDWSGQHAQPARSGAPANGLSPVLMEEYRERGELQRMYYGLLHALVHQGPLDVLLQIPQSCLEAMLTALAQGAATHVDPSVRRTCVHALGTLVREWGDRINADQGFKQFILDRVGGDACIRGVLQGGLDPKDAATVSFLEEVAACLRAVHEKCGYEFLARLSLILPSMGMPHDIQQQFISQIQQTDTKQLKNYLKSTLQKLTQVAR